MNRRSPDRQLALLVDDDPVVLLLAARALEESGLRVLQASSGEEALALVDREIPDVVLLDVMMPGMDGFAVCAALRRNPLLQYLPVLMMTGLDDTESVLRAYEARATDFVSKPVHWLLLGHRVRYLLRSAVAFRQLSASRAQLARSEGLLAAAHRIARIATWEWDARSRVLKWSSARDGRLGEHVELPSTLGQYFRLVHPDDRARVRRHFRTSIDLTTAGTQGGGLEHRIVDSQGRVRLIELELEATSDETSGVASGMHGTVRDITERWEAEQRIRHLADHDVLTGLPNRQLIIEQAALAFGQATRDGTRAGLLFVDLDHFKQINDTHGHSAGDAVLRTVADRLRGALRGRREGSRVQDSLARIGGDEFVALVTDVRDDGIVMDLARRLLGALRAPLVVDGQEHHVSGSIGVAIYPRDGADYDVLMRKADAAMYLAKVSGRGAARMHLQAC